MSQFPEVIARMATDGEFAEHARAHAEEVAAEFGLTPDETAQLRTLTDEGVGNGPTALDPRLSKSGIGAGGLAGLLAAAMPDRPGKDEEQPDQQRPLGRWVGPGSTER